MAKLHNKIGPPVEGDDFFGRDAEILHGWADLENGNNLLIVAPRRVGKSSFAKRLIKEARSLSWNGAYVDVQEVRTEIEFFEVFFDTLDKASGSWFSKGKDKAFAAFNLLLDKVKLEWESDAGTFSLGLGGSTHIGVKKSLDELLSKVGEMLIVVDELPYFLNRIEAAERGQERVSDFLHLLRSIRQKSGNKVSWIFCGSIGLDTFAGRLGLTSTLNDLLPFDISAFDDLTSRAFLRKLGGDNNVPLSENNIGDILEIIGWPLPFFLQAHFGQLRRLLPLDCKFVTKQMIEEAYRALVQNVLALKTWDERLGMQIPDLEDMCRKVLKLLSKYRKGLTRSNLFGALYKTGDNLDVLEVKLSRCLTLLRHDGYLIIIGESYAFRSPLLRDFWYDRYVK